MSLITIFITPKGFEREHIALIQKNAVRSWQALGDDVECIWIGNDPGVAEAAAELNVNYVADVKRNASGTPLLSDIFRIGREFSNSPLLAYVNADIILMPDFVETARKVMEHEKDFLLVGQRWDLDVKSVIDYSDGWEKRLEDDVKLRGRRHPAGGSDYFIYPRSCFETIPDFAIGRSGWDNWMFYEARLKNWKLINCSETIDIIHQDHDYAHLPNGQSHYRLPESAENIKMAGGNRMIFTLADCDWEMQKDGSIVKPPKTKAKILREAEIFPLITLKSKGLGQAAYTLFHPKKSLEEWRRK